MEALTAVSVSALTEITRLNNERSLSSGARKSVDCTV
jgi:hypothetical protein